MQVTPGFVDGVTTDCLAEGDNSLTGDARAPEPAPGEPVIVDVKFVFSDEAEDINRIYNWTAVAIWEANAALLNQGNRLRYRIEDFVPVTQNEYADAEQDLDWLKTSTHATTSRGTADLVTYITESSNACGLADGINWMKDQSETVFRSTLQFGCMRTRLTLPHELGHNIGLNHDEYVLPANYTAAVPDAYGIARYLSINHPCGWYTPMRLCNTQFGVRSILAYETYCTDQGGTCPRIAAYSDPAYYLGTFNWYLGITGQADNNRVADYIAPTIAAYR